MALFDRLDKIASRVVDRVNAITFVLTPRSKTPNGRPQVDSSRPVVTGKGVLDYISAEYGIQLGVRKSYREANDLRSLQVGRDPQLSIDMSYFASALAEARQDDLIQFPDRPELPDFTVGSAQRDGMNRMVLDLLQIGGQA